MGRIAAAGCLLAVLCASSALAQGPPDPVFWDGFDPCPPATGECDGDRAVVCETPLDTTTDCGDCGVTCDLANATESCGTGTCLFEACTLGFATCDGNDGNGCEVQISGHSNAPPGENLGMHDADSVGGALCQMELGCSFLLSRLGRGGRFFHITAREASSCCAYVGLRFELVVPPGADYDLYVTGAPQCDAAGCRSTNGTNVNEQLNVWKNDDCGGADDTFTVQVEIRYSSGTSCQPWELRVYRRQC
jgi:hypothetical protein